MIDPPLPHLIGRKVQQPKQGVKVRGHLAGTTMLLQIILVFNSLASFRAASKMPPSVERTVYLVMGTAGGVVFIFVLICAVVVFIRRLSEQRKEDTQ